MKKIIVKNEKQFAEWFRKNYRKLGFSKIVRGDISRCPDFIMMRDGKEIGVELETVASNFIAHKHQLDKVDEILCIIKNIDLGKPVNVAKDLIFQGNRKVTLSIESEVYDKFQKYCEDNAILLSKKIELVMLDIMDEKKEENRKR